MPTDDIPSPPVTDKDVAAMLENALEAGTRGVPGRHSQSWVPPSVDEISPQLPDFEIISLIGRGGMGAVYKAIQTSLHRPVAVKLLPPELGESPEFEQRFRREALALAKLNHPNIVQIHDFGQTEGGHFYFVMELVEGRDLKEAIKNSDLSSRDVFDVVGQICDALQFAHSKGFVHRDIKPANIFLNSQGEVKVGDFGLVRLVHDRPPGDDHGNETMALTMTGDAMGSPGYVAPEQLTEGARIDQRADIYSLGVMILEMLTGDIQIESLDQLKKYESGISEAVSKSIEVDPDNRFQAVAELRNRLEEIRSPKAKATKQTIIFIAVLALVMAVTALAYSSIVKSRYIPKPVEGQLAGEKVIFHNNSRGGRDLPTTKDPAAAKRDMPFENSLGMRLVPVPVAGANDRRILMSIWETRVKDFARFFEANAGRQWRKPVFPQGDEHPAVFASWKDGVDFSRWLTKLENDSGGLPERAVYRLPTDHEWSCAVGIGKREDKDVPPTSKSNQIDDWFAWGKAWPPLSGSANILGEEVTEPLYGYGRIKGYYDNYIHTAPVGMFLRNRCGLFDLGGNVREACLDWCVREKGTRTSRGSSVRHQKVSDLLASNRHSIPAEGAFSLNGFRIVLDLTAVDNPTATFPDQYTEAEVLTREKNEAFDTGFPVTSELSGKSLRFYNHTRGGRDLPTERDPFRAKPDSPYQNRLGMRFVPVPVVGGPSDGKLVLFSIWETRIRDYQVFVNAGQMEWPEIPYPHGPEYPAVNVSWNNATAFCDWLNQYDPATSSSGKKLEYRLPLDHEWSCAAGIGNKEDPLSEPLSKKAIYRVPGDWKYQEGAGNLCGTECESIKGWSNFRGYQDDFVFSAPTGVFQRSKTGLFDLRGNVKEWCFDYMKLDEPHRTIRSSSFNTSGQYNVALSNRGNGGLPDAGNEFWGFRVVLSE